MVLVNIQPREVLIDGRPWQLAIIKTRPAIRAFATEPHVVDIRFPLRPSPLREVSSIFQPIVLTWLNPPAANPFECLLSGMFPLFVRPDYGIYTGPLAIAPLQVRYNIFRQGWMVHRGATSLLRQFLGPASSLPLAFWKSIPLPKERSIRHREIHSRLNIEPVTGYGSSDNPRLPC